MNAMTNIYQRRLGQMDSDRRGRCVGLWKTPDCPSKP
jgi:hypothetical protein